MLLTCANVEQNIFIKNYCSMFQLIPAHLDLNIVQDITYIIY